MTEPREPPYPADTLAKGWRFEVHMEKVKRSDTWLLAKTGEVRGALMLLWGEAWEQTPCGSLPADEALVALIIDMPAAKFAKHRSVLMRGWWLATDGRLYHDTIVERVLAMLEKRAADAKRAADRRARQAAAAAEPPDITDASRVTPTGRTAKQTVSSTPSTKHQNSEAKASGAAAAAPSVDKSTKTPKALALNACGAWLIENGLSESGAREVMGLVLRDFKDVAIEALNAAAASGPQAKAEAYLINIAQTKAGERVKSNTVPSAAAEQTQAYLAQREAERAVPPGAKVPDSVREARAKLGRVPATTEGADA